MKARAYLLHLKEDALRTTETDQGKRQVDEALEYCWNIYRLCLDWYKVADAKGQLLLTLNGVFITVMSSILVVAPDRLVGLKAALPILPWILMGGVGILVGFSVSCALACLFSRISNSDVDKYQKEFFEDDSEGASHYHPAAVFWFGTTARINRDVGAHMLLNADKEFALKALTRQIMLLSPNVLKKHQWVNRGWAAASVALLFVIGSVTSIVIAVN